MQATQRDPDADAPWRKSFANYRVGLVLELGRELDNAEQVRAKNAYSQRIAPSALATLIRSGRQR